MKLRKELSLNILAISVLLAMAVAAPAQAQHAVMHPDEATLLQWKADLDSAPQFVPDPSLAEQTQGPSPKLLDHITYTPTERNQSSCGNCWVWAGTALLEINHSVIKGVNDRLSIQRFDSCYFQDQAASACGGGSLATFAGEYNENLDPIPWSNTNAQFQDGGGGNPAVACNSIGTNPTYYSIYNAPNQMQAVTVPWYGVGQSTAISNIKNALLQNKGVGYSFALANATDWNAFRNFWNNGAATDLWSPNAYCGHTWNPNPGQGGAHLVTIVGWNDDDAANPYWLVLNSWGTTTNRPTGLFRLRMDINYDCLLPLSGGGNYYGVSFQTLTANFSDGTYTLDTDTNSMWQAAKGGGTSKSVFVRSKPSTAPVNSGYSSWTNIGGTTSHAPALMPFNSRLYMAVKGVVSNKLWIRSMGSNKVWAPWVNIPGSTSESPSLVVWRNRLYIFVKGNATGTVWYSSINTAGVLDSWRQVPSWVTIGTPAAAVMNDELVLYVIGTDNKLYLRTMATPNVWGGSSVISNPAWDLRSDKGLSATVWKGQIILVAKGDIGAIGNTVRSMASVAGTAGSYYSWTAVPGGTTTARPQVGFGPEADTLFVTALGSTGTDKIWYNAFVGDQWFNSTGVVASGNSTDTAASAMYYWR